MWVTWIFVALALAMVVGPVMMLRPGPGTSKLAAIRAYANSRGIAIRLPSPKTGSERHTGTRAAYYTLPLDEKTRKMAAVEPWSIAKNQQEHEIHFQGFWDWKSKNRPREVICTELRAALQSIPEGIIGIEFNAAGVSVLWDEACRGKTTTAAVDEIIAYLTQLSDVVLSHPLPAEFLGATRG